MLRQYQQLIESVVNLDQEVNRNEAIVEALTAYVEMELAGENPAQKFPELYQQLTIDADLQETYVALRLILLMEKEQDIVQPTKPLQLNLSFLQKEKEPSTPLASNLWEKVGDSYRLAVELTAQIGEHLVQLIDLSPLLLPYHRLEAIPVRDEDLVFQEIQEIPLPDANFQMLLLTSIVEDGMGTIVIEFKPIASDKWHESSPVVILLSNQHPVQRVAANVPGRVNFSELHAGNYQIQVKVNSTSYEYSIQLVATRT